MIDPAGRHSPGAAEWQHLKRVRALGIAVPEVVAAGERIGPWGRLQSFLMVADLVDSQPLHEAIPALARRLDPPAFAAWKRALVAAMAEITATLHRANLFHKDLYLCHFFLDPTASAGSTTPRHERRAADPDRPAPAGAPPGLAAPLALEGPGPAPVLDLRGRRASTTATGSGSGGATRRQLGLQLAGAGRRG